MSQSRRTRILKITGTWQLGLFPTYDFTEEQQKNLVEKGKLITLLTFKDDTLIEDKTLIEMILDENLIVQESGTKFLHQLLDVYLSK